MRDIAASIAERIPLHIKDQHDDFVAFIQAYFEYVDQQNVDVGSARDLDDALDQFVDHILSEVAVGIPERIATDKRLLAKHIHDVYSSKGSFAGHNLIFRILYNLDSEIMYPSERILRASDGKWSRIRQLLLRKIDGPIDTNLFGAVLYKGEDPVAAIDSFSGLVGDQDAPLFNILLTPEREIESIDVGDILSTNFGEGAETRFIALSHLSRFDIIQQGSKYFVGDEIFVVCNTTGNTAKARITNVTAPTNIGDVPFVFDTETELMQIMVEGIPVDGAVIVSFDSLFQSGSYPVVASDGTSITIQPIHGTRSLFEVPPLIEGTVFVQDNTTSGGIQNIVWLSRGNEIVDPSFTVQSNAGEGAQLNLLLGAVADIENRFADNSGRLSDSYIVLADNRKYQSFSYIIRVAETIKTWRDIIKKTVHPAGMAMFSELVSTTLIRLPSSTIVPKHKTIITSQCEANVHIRDSVVRSRVQSKAERATGSRNVRKWNTLSENVFPSLRAISIYDQDALYSGHTNANFVGTANEGYWYSFGSNNDVTYHFDYDESLLDYSSFWLESPERYQSFFEKWNPCTNELLTGSSGLDEELLFDHFFESVGSYSVGENSPGSGHLTTLTTLDYKMPNTRLGDFLDSSLIPTYAGINGDPITPVVKKIVPQEIEVSTSENLSLTTRMWKTAGVNFYLMEDADTAGDNPITKYPTSSGDAISTPLIIRTNFVPESVIKIMKTTSCTDVDDLAGYINLAQTSTANTIN